VPARSLFACLGTTTGMLLQKFAHNLDPSVPGVVATAHAHAYAYSCTCRSLPRVFRDGGGEDGLRLTVRTAAAGNMERKERLWWMSLIMMVVIPTPLDILALGLAAQVRAPLPARRPQPPDAVACGARCAQSLLAPLSAATLLFVIIFAPLYLPEKILLLDVIAVTLICIGAVVTTYFGNHKQEVGRARPPRPPARRVLV
jgi:hypothetical protein